MNPIEAGKEALEAIVTPLREEKERLTERIAEIDLTLKPLEAAIGPLGGKSRSAKKGKAKPTARTVTQEDARGVLVELVTAKPGVAEEALLAKAKQVLKVKHGLDLKGFVNRCREVLGSEPFVVHSDGTVRLAAAPKASSEPGKADLPSRGSDSSVDNFAAGVLGH